MIWYSVKAHRPPMDVRCLVFTQTNYYYLANLIDGEDPTMWSCENECACDSSDQIIYGVTHFAIPSPVKELL